MTGSSGFVGRHFLNAYNSKFTLSTVQLRTTNVESIDFTNIDSVLHLAGLAHQSAETPAKMYFDVNTVLTIHLAKAAKQAGVKQFVYFSSIKVYGSDGSVLDDNLIIDETTPLRPTDPYGQSKAAAEEALLELQSDTFGVAIVRPAMVYGPSVKGNMRSLIKLIDKMPVLPLNYNRNRRSIVSIRNLMFLTERLLLTNSRGIFIGIDAEPVSIEYLSRCLAEGLGKKRYLLRIPKFVFDILVRITPGAMSRLFGTLAFRQKNGFAEIGFKPLQTTREGLTEMCEWYKNEN